MKCGVNWSSCTCLTSISTRRLMLADRLWSSVSNPDHILYDNFPSVLPRSGHFSVPPHRTAMHQNSFFLYMTLRKNQIN